MLGAAGPLRRAAWQPTPRARASDAKATSGKPLGARARSLPGKVASGQLVASRSPPDLPHFTKAALGLIEKAVPVGPKPGAAPATGAR